MQILLLLCFLATTYARWGDPKLIYKTRTRINEFATFLDQATNILHVIYLEDEESHDHLKICYINYKNGEVSRPYVIANEGVTVELSITGAHNGKNLFAAIRMYRNNKIADNYFVESKDNGEHWSKPVLSRANSLNDRERREKASLLYVHTDRLFFFYVKEDGVYMTTRAPDSILWSAESKIMVDEYPLVPCYHTVDSVVGCNDKSIHVAIANDTGGLHVPVILTSYDNGLHWYDQKFPSTRVINVSPSFAKNDAFGFCSLTLVTTDYVNSGLSWEVVYVKGTRQNEITKLADLPIPAEAKTAKIALCQLGDYWMVTGLFNGRKLPKGDIVMSQLPLFSPWKQDKLEVPFKNLLAWHFDIDLACAKDRMVAITDTTEGLYIQEYTPA